MDLLTRTDIQTLASDDTEGTHVSLFIPTHRFGSGVQADQLQWKNLVNSVESILLEELKPRDVEQLLAPARELQHDAKAWQYMSDGLAMFLLPGSHRTYRIPAPLPALAAAGEHFITGPLMRLLSGDGHFLLLAISQSQVRLMDGSRHTVRQIELDEVPTSLEDVVEPEDSRPDSMARAVGGRRGGRAVFYGHGAGDSDVKKDDLVRFLREVAAGLEDVLAGQTAPMVLVGLEQNIAMWRDVNKYPGVLDEAVFRNPDDLSAEELHDVAWPIVEARVRSERNTVIERFGELQGSGQVSDDLAIIHDAAEQGRVDTLFVRTDPSCWESVVDPSEAAVVRLGTDDRYVVCEQLDDAAAATLRYGGQVIATADELVANGEVAAILRF